MQVDRMFSAEASITIQQIKKKLSYNGAKTAAHKHSFKSSAIKNGRQEKEKLRTCRWRKEKRDEHLKLLTMPCTILFYKNYKILIIRTLLKII